MFQDEGASTLRIGMELGVVDRAWIMEGKGSRRGPENENPKIASITESVSLRAEWKSSMNGMERSLSWVARRWLGVSGMFGVDLKSIQREIMFLKEDRGIL